MSNAPVLQRRHQRRPLIDAIALALSLVPATVLAGTVTGPGASHTVNPGDTPEIWFVEDGATLNIASGGATKDVQVSNANVLGSNINLSGVTGIRLSNGSTADIAGGQIVIASSIGDAGGVQSGSQMSLDALTVTSAGRGFTVVGAGSTLTLANSTIAAESEALRVSNSGLLVLNNVSADSSSNLGLQMNGGSVRAFNSTISGTSGGARMDGSSQLYMERSTLEGGLVLFGTPNDPSQASSATLVNSLSTGSIGASVQNGSSITTVGSTLTGSGTGFGGAGVWLLNGTLSAQQGSLIEGANVGIEVAGGQANRVAVDQSRVVSGTDAAISVGSTATADILITSGSDIKGGNGVALTVASGGLANLSVSGSMIDGDVIGATDATSSSTVNIDLSSNASLLGAITGGNQVSVTDSLWRLTGNSSIQQLSVAGNALIELGNGGDFHTLNVEGDFIGNGGVILFNTVLADDSSATDRLVIGGSTVGATSIRVNNVAGKGAQTSKGIELISVGGASDANFELIGRAVGGSYDYFLFKGVGADGNWYLRSQLPTEPDPCDLDPTLPACNPIDPGPGPDPVDPGPEPEPVVRPEGGAYLANLLAAQSMFRIGYHDRYDGQNSGRAWARVNGARTGFDAVSRQLDIRGNSQALSVGADMWRTDGGSSVGVMLSSGNSSSTSTNALTGYYARGKVKGEALGVYGTWRGGNTVDPYAGFYVDGSIQRAQFRNRVEGIGLVGERYDSRAWQGALETGYAFRVGGAADGGVFLEPQLQVGYNRWDEVRHVESNGTVVTTDDADGLFGRIGLRLSGVTRWGNGAAQVQPYLAAHWLHTRAESQVNMDDERVDARIPRSRGEFSGGASVKFANGIGAWGGLSLQRASGYHQTSAQLGLNYNW